MSRYNILLLSAGRRVSLARALRRVAGAQSAMLFCADMYPHLSAACQDSGDAVCLPHVNAPDYSASLEDLCRKNDIGLIIPTIDTELALLAGMREVFAAQGTTVAVSAPDLIAIARDKRLTASHFATFGVRSPTVIPTDAPTFPAIAKPFDGSLSRDVHVLHHADHYSERIRSIPNLMLAEYLDPADYDEFTCDAYYDREERLRCVVPRLRLEVRGGEVSKARTVRNNIVDLFDSQLSYLPGARGCLTFQLFRHRSTGDLYLIEVNARFGGGFPLSLAAGADYPAWLYAEYVLDQSIAAFSDWEVGLTMLRYDGEVLVRGGEAHG